MNRPQPFTLDPVTASLARLGEPYALSICARALQDGIEYASISAARATPEYDIEISEVIAGVRSYLGLPSTSTAAANPFVIPIVGEFLQKSHYSDAHVRGLLREVARAVVSDLIHDRQPRAGLLQRIRHVVSQLLAR